MAYPSSLDELTDGVPSDGAAPTTALDNATYPHDDHHRALATAVEAIEAELGTDPSGSSATVAARFAALSSGGAPPLASFASGFWWSTPGYPDTLTIAVNRAHAVPFVCPRAVTITRLGAEVSSAGSSGSLVRLGIYNDSSGLPGSLLLDAGTINGTSATYQEITISQALSANTKYWFVMANQGGGTLSVRGGRGGFSVPQAYTGGSPSNEAGSLMQYSSTWSGALIDPFPAVDDFRGVAPRFTVKVA